jgi:hypothetical protein
MAKIRRLVLDTLKPHEPSIIEMADRLGDLEGVDSVNISVYEIDRKVENVKMTLEGKNIDFEEVEALVRELGGSIHSIDEAVAGQSIIDDASTPQD